jgi:3-hydroxyisobutyrate dehydrogenase
MAIIAWIGLGQMGRPMAANLVSAGHEVRGVEINPLAAAEAQASGVNISETVTEAVAGADFVFTMLPEGQPVEAALTGPDGVFSKVGPDAIVVDCSTIDVAHSRTLHTLAQSAGVRFLDAPVSGGMSGAIAATLTIMVGGDDTVFAVTEPVLKDVGSYVVHMGGPGSGQATKIVNNMILGVCLAATCEGVDLAERLGLDTRALYEVVTRSSGDNWALRTWYPVAGVVDTAPSGRDFASGFSTRLLTKDLKLALGAGQATGSSLETAKTAYRLFEDHAVGHSQLDCSSLVVRLRTATGAETNSASAQFESTP